MLAVSTLRTHRQQHRRQEPTPKIQEWMFLYSEASPSITTQESTVFSINLTMKHLAQHHLFN